MLKTQIAEKQCRKCGEMKPVGEFGKHPYGAGGRTGRCKQCIYAREKETREQSRAEVMAAYGPVCALCGFNDQRCLDIDHIDGRGKRDRPVLKYRDHKLRTHLKKLGYPKDEVRLLCKCCNQEQSRLRLLYAPGKQYAAATNGEKRFRCLVCKEPKPASLFSPWERSRAERGIQGRCNECRAKEVRQSLQDLRGRILAAYGHKCQLCSESGRNRLDIDHIHGGGKRMVKELGDPRRFYREIEKAGYPKDNYRLLCSNCNWLEKLRLEAERCQQEGKHD